MANLQHVQPVYTFWKITPGKNCLTFVQFNVVKAIMWLVII